MLVSRQRQHDCITKMSVSSVNWPLKTLLPPSAEYPDAPMGTSGTDGWWQVGFTGRAISNTVANAGRARINAVVRGGRRVWIFPVAGVIETDVCRRCSRWPRSRVINRVHPSHACIGVEGENLRQVTNDNTRVVGSRSEIA